MSNDIRAKLLELSDYVNNFAPPHRFLPYVVERIEEMIESLNTEDLDYENLRDLALGLGMFISDDFEFSESETGTKILDVINSIRSSK